MAREKDSAPNLAELIGMKKEPVGLKDLPNLLGEKMPQMEFSQVGRIRLVRALKNRFGDGFRNIPGIKDILSQFDKETKTNALIAMNKRGRK